MVITVQLTPNGKVTEMTTEEADEQKRDRIYSGASLNTPEHWEHKQYKLTMTMLDAVDYEEDDINVIATTIYRHMRSPDFTPDDNNLEDGLYKQRDNRQDHRLYKGGPDVYLQAGVQTRKNQNDLKTYRIDSNIYMENATTTEPVSEEATAKQKRIDELRKYNRDYYHALKKGVGVRALQ